jgi:Glycosyltransferase family 17
MKIVDCFIFYNELKMLEFRLEYLYNTVDWFVLVEATKTHAGNPKPLFFQENKDRFSKYLDKIVHIVVDDMPMQVATPAKRGILPYQTPKQQKQPDYSIIRENYQRICIVKGIQKLTLDDDDLIIISDVDEIPDRNTLKTLNIDDNVYGLLQDFYYYNLTCKNTDFWTMSRILKFGTYKKQHNTQFIRFGILPDVSKLIPRGGWHFSYFGSPEFIANKLKNFCHQEFNNSNFTDIQTIETRVKEGVDLLCRSTEKFMKIPIEENTYLPEGYEFLTTF